VAHGRDPRHPEVDYQRRAAAVIGPDGSRRGYLVIYQDITPRRAVDRLKEDFLAGVTHDLRTPLASIKGFAETMLRDRHMEPATREEFTRIICAESTRLQEMIEDLLDLRRMEAGKADLSPGSVNLRALVEEVAHASRPLLESKDLSLAKIEWVGDGERPVLGDVAKLGRAVRNILSNAIKYSRHGGRIWIRGVESENCVALEFTDEGPGIPEHEIDHVFEKFYRGSEHVRRTQGTGLGLAIVKNIVENHGGRVSARNAPKRGATIRIVLPWDLGSLAESADASEVNGSARTAAGVANA
jgi:two-component system phosphate regulon sensor histidine kinase PhoR